MMKLELKASEELVAKPEWMPFIDLLMSSFII